MNGAVSGEDLRSPVAMEPAKPVEQHRQEQRPSPLLWPLASSSVSAFQTETLPIGGG